VTLSDEYNDAKNRYFAAKQATDGAYATKFSIHKQHKKTDSRIATFVVSA
jgi:hypothetical protein